MAVVQKCFLHVAFVMRYVRTEFNWGCQVKSRFIYTAQYLITISLRGLYNPCSVCVWHLLSFSLDSDEEIAPQNNLLRRKKMEEAWGRATEVDGRTCSRCVYRTEQQKNIKYKYWWETGPCRPSVWLFSSASNQGMLCLINECSMQTHNMWSCNPAQRIGPSLQPV